jgi:hypothetical protein
MNNESCFNLKVIMKKLAYLLMVVPLFLAGCGDDKDVPDFDVEVVFGAGSTVSDDVVTVAQGTPLVIESVSPINYTASSIAFGTVTYIVDYGAEVITNVAPFAVTLETSNLAVGLHLLQITFPVYAVDYSICRAVVTYQLNITMPADDDTTTEATVGGRLTANPKVTTSG